MSESIEILNISIKRNTITADAVPELHEMFGINKLPLATAKISIEIKNVSVAVINALRRTITDEMLGYALMIPKGGYVIKDMEKRASSDKIITDKFMIEQFMSLNISSIRLKSQIPKDVIKELRLSLNVVNDGVDTKTIYSGDLRATQGSLPFDLFNPTSPIGFIQPNTCIDINDIYISSGYGRDSALYNVTCCAAYTHLDLEQYSHEEQHAEDGVAVEKSGYKKSCLIANPRHHQLSAIIPAIGENTIEAKNILVDACSVIREKLKLISTTLEKTDITRKSVTFKVIEGLNEGTLSIIGESYTIGNLLTRTIFDNYENVRVSFKVIPTENILIINIQHPTTDIREIITKSIDIGIEIFEQIRNGIVATAI